MKVILYAVLSTLFLLIFLTACTQEVVDKTPDKLPDKTPDKDQLVCTAEYAPVCGKIEVQCVTAPCDPIQQTFSNRCNAEVRNAFDIVEGECVPDSVVTDFTSCADAGNPVMESYPRQCRSNGKTYVEVI